MIALRLVVCFALLAASALATNVRQCPGREFENLSDNVQLSPLTEPPYILKKGTNLALKISFTPGNDVTDCRNHVTAHVSTGISLPFIGVDSVSICDKVYLENGDKASCPLKAGTKYTYKETFPILPFYPETAIIVHWGLLDTHQKELICFEVPAKIK